MDNRIPQFRNRKHWTPRYVHRRLALMLTDLLHPDWPMLTKDAILWLDEHLTKDMVGVEFGGGRSTLWLAARLGTLSSVENNPAWMRKAPNVANFLTGDFVSVANQLSGSSQDFVLVDGLNRGKVALAMMGKLKSGGILVVDDIERYLPSTSKTFGASPTRYASEAWASFYIQVVDWKCIWTTNGIRDTAIWVKP